MIKTKKLNAVVWLQVILVSVLVSACGGPNSDESAGSNYVPSELSPRSYETGALIYTGTGAASESVNGLVDIAEDRNLSYRLVTASDLNDMSTEEMARYGVLIMPGGLAGKMTKAITPETRARVRKAVRAHGLGYVGFCAGAWMAVGPAPEGDENPDWGYAIIPAAKILPEYPPNGKIMNMDNGPMIVTVTRYDQEEQDLVFWGGAYFPDAPMAVARYKDGKPAIVQATADEGFLALSGPHPEAPDAWRAGNDDADGGEVDADLAWSLITAALERKPLPSF